MIRVLQCVNNMHRAGLETMLMNYYRHIDRNEIQFDFLTHRPERADYDDEIERLGGRVFYAPRLYPQNYAAYFSFMKDFFQAHPEYQIVHSHIDSMSFLPLLAAKRAGVPVRIAHSHSTSIDRDIKYPLKQVFRFSLPLAANRFLACGSQAGRFLFRNHDFKIIPNAVDPLKYLFAPSIRMEMRERLGLSDAYVMGHVGRFSYAKNHAHLVNIFHAVSKQNEKARLLLIGRGENESAIRQQVERLGLSEKVLFMGSQAEVGRFYQAMDVFVMPSLFEGVPLTGVEAQLAQLPCIFSDRVPQEVAFTADCRFVPLDEPIQTWADEILKTGLKERIPGLQPDGPYDIRTASAILTDMYRALLKETT